MDRRHFLALGGAAATALTMPRMAFAKAATERRFLFVIQRGAADGLAIVAPTGDPAYAGLRGDLAADLQGGTRLDAMFTLHPAMAQTAALYARKQALFVQAVASPYRDRSHFDGQNVLETGASAPYARRDGWLNRLVSALPGSAEAIAFAPTVPQALRGPAKVASYAPSNLPDASQDLMIRAGDLYARDPQLGPMWNAALAARAQAGALADGRGAAAAGALAARMMTGASGARIGMIETDGWDTHAGQRARLAGQLRGLDGLIDSFRSGMGDAWSDTLVIVATEFGRTARANGTGGTDHGTGAAAMLLGGAVSGGRVIADWPGLSAAALYEGRDLKPTMALNALIATALAQHFDVAPSRMAGLLFHETATTPLSGRLVAS